MLNVMKRLVLLVIIIVSTIAARAQTFAEIKALAEKGDAEAQYELSTRYAGVDDYKNAFLWLQKSAESGNAQANVELAKIYFMGGLGQSKNLNKGVEYLIKAAEMTNSPELQVMVGTAYLTDGSEAGYTLKKDLNEAEKWFRKALVSGDEAYAYERERNRAKSSLGDIYYERKDYAEAAKWYAMVGDADAQNKLAQMYQKDLGLAKNSKWAAELYRKAAEEGIDEANDCLYMLERECYEYQRRNLNDTSLNGLTDWIDVVALNALGQVYYGKGEYEDAVRYYRQAADKGYADAQTALGELYLSGDSIKKDETEALKLFKQAAAQNNTVAMRDLGAIYKMGYGVPKDTYEAAKWYRKGAELGNPDCMTFLAELILLDAVKGNYKEALEWLNKAVDYDYSYKQYLLGMAYEAGKGTAVDIKEAIKWYKKAAAQGDENAQLRLTELEKYAKSASLEGCVFELNMLSLTFMANSKFESLAGWGTYTYNPATQSGELNFTNTIVGELVFTETFTISGDKLTMTNMDKVHTLTLKKGKIPKAN